MDSLGALKTALEREMKGQQAYQKAAAKAADPKGRRLFEWLAFEQSGHIDLLMQVIIELQKKAQWPAKDVWIASGHLSEPIQTADIPPKTEIIGHLPANAPEISILKKAIQAEQEDAAFYAKLAQSITDPSGRAMLEQLAQIEAGHQKLLEEELEWARGSNDMFTLLRFLPVG